MLIKKNRSEGKSESRDRYLITYADLITLLLGLFVILYASSQVDKEKFKQYSEAFSEYFHSPRSVLDGGDGVLDGAGKALPEPILPSRGQRSLDEIAKEAEEALSSFLADSLVTIQRSGNRIVLSFPEKLLFPSGKANIQNDGIIVLDSLAGVLRGIKYQITVDGHTDTDPIRTFQYESNWHLSVDRALNVGYTLVQRGIPELNLSVRGFGCQRPLATNDTEAGKMKNRRVEISISELPPDAPSTEGYESQVDDTTGQE